MFSKIIEGGPIFTVPILLLLLLIIILFVKGILDTNKKKSISLISSIGLFAFVWGLLGQMIGLVGAFDTIQQVGDISLSMMAGGLKISLLAPIFGFVTFLFSRLGVIILIWIQKENE